MVARLECPIADLITEREPVVIGADASLADAVTALQTHRIGAVVIVAGRRPLGIFTERDLLLKVVGKIADLTATPLTSFMSDRLVTLKASDPISRAILSMRAGNFRHLPIVDGAGDLRAVLSLKDVVNFVADSFELKL